MSFYELPNEQVVLRQLMLGDVDAFRCVYEGYEARVHVFAYRLTKSRDLAAEIVQEVFIRLWEKRAQIDPEKSFGGYIKTITFNHTLNMLKKAARDQALQQKIYLNMQGLRSNASDVVLEKELARVYRQAVDSLSPQKKLVYQLSREEELNYEQIAERLNLSRNTVRNHMVEALRSIRTQVSDHAFLLGVAFLLFP